MSKRKVSFGDTNDQYEGRGGDDFDMFGDQMPRSSTVEDNHFRYKKYKNSLDSDEEDVEEKADKYNILDPEELEGQEDATIDFDGDIKITPFNMKEELEEGHFDKHGTYVFHREKDAIRDSWLDNIDWVKVKHKEPEENDAEESDSEDDNARSDADVTEIYKKMLEIMKPKETVQKAITRLGKAFGQLSTSASSRWKKKKEGADASQNETEEAQKEADRSQMLLLTSLADQIIQTGNMDVYQFSYEQIKFAVQSSEERSVPLDQSLQALGNIDQREMLDMFGDDFVETRPTVPPVVSKVEQAEKMEVAGEEPATNEGSKGLPSGEEMWEFRWENEPDSTIYGPHSSSQMLEWTNEGYFPNGVWARRINQKDGHFYNSKRIDFELYT